MHECDLLVVNKGGFAYEIEIKVSRADVKKDLTKAHVHPQTDRIKRLYFAIPAELATADVLSFIPAHAGILVVARRLRKHGLSYIVDGLRDAVDNSKARPWSVEELAKLGRLGTLRFWKLHNTRVIESAFNSIQTERGGIIHTD